VNILQHFKDGLSIAAAAPFALYLRFVKYAGQEIWLVGERKDEASDNGYHLFKYVRECHPAQPVHYVIERGSPDVKKVGEYGNLLFYGEFQHYVYWLAARRLVCAHMGSCVPDNALCWTIDRILKTYLNRKRIFIQHGITKENVPALSYDNTKFDLFVCGAAAEAKFVASTFGYPEGNVLLLGFPRFDALHNFIIKKQILVMPTWRKYLSVGSTWGKVNESSLNQFLNSRYYENYQKLLNHSSLHRLLQEADYQLVFYPHYEMQSVAHLFSSTCARVTITHDSDCDVQQLLKESAFLVTDYSSVAFDFAYMRKAVLYFQFDHEEYAQGHYAKGYFDYERDGFGPIVGAPEQVVAELKDFILSGSANNREEYIERQKTFFVLHDMKNCERTYQAIRTI
jgi:CDP-glycerol glycerophosphotransferase